MNYEAVTPVFNERVNDVDTRHQFKILEARAENLHSLENKKQYLQMRKDQDVSLGQKFEEQQARHKIEIQQAITDYHHDMRGYEMTPTSPKLREQQAEEYANRKVANAHQREIAEVLDTQVKQCNGFLTYCEELQQKEQSNKLEFSRVSSGKSLDKGRTM